MLDEQLGDLDLVLLVVVAEALERLRRVQVRALAAKAEQRHQRRDRLGARDRRLHLLVLGERPERAGDLGVDGAVLRVLHQHGELPDPAVVVHRVLVGAVREHELHEGERAVRLHDLVRDAEEG